MTTTVTIDLDALVDSLTLGEAAEIESITGVPISQTIRGGGVSGTAVLAFAFILGRRRDPEYTIHQARALRFEDVSLAAAEPEPATDG